LARLLRSPLYRDQLEQASTGATMKNISNTSLAELPIVLPQIDEQRRIVAILDEAFEGIATAKAHAEKNLRNARDVLVQHLRTVFAATQSETIPVSKLAHCSLGKMLDKAKNKGDMQPYLRNINVRWFAFELDDVLEMRFSPDEAEKYTVRRGDLVICEGGYPGRSAIWDSDEPMYFQKALHRARFHQPVHAHWVQYYLYAQDSAGLLSRHFTGSGIQHLTGAALARMALPLPDLATVERHVKTFNQLRHDTDRLALAYSSKLSTLDELKQSLLHQAFSGAL
jgi:type I restriction enzyme S subunit